MDSNLSFKVHVKTKCATAMRNVMKITRIRRFLTKDAYETPVLGLVIAHLDYSNSMLVNTSDCTLTSYQKLRNMCAKLVLNRNKYDSSLTTLKSLHWLPVRARIHFKILSLMHQCTYEKSPSYLSQLLQEKQSLRCVRGNTCDAITCLVV